jgi:hypothetical protein
MRKRRHENVIVFFASFANFFGSIVIFGILWWIKAKGTWKENDLKTVNDGQNDQCLFITQKIL